MKKVWKKLKEWVSPMAVVLLVVFLFAVIVSVTCKYVPDFADSLHNSVGTVIRAGLAYLTAIFPFSIAEYLLIVSPLLFVLLIMGLVKKLKKSTSSGIRYTVNVLCLASLVFSIFTFGYAGGYYEKPISEKVGIERKDLSADDLEMTALLLLDGIYDDLGEIGYNASGSSVMPYTHPELNRKLIAAYDTLHETYPAFHQIHVGTKPVFLSEPWTYTHISGVYTFFTGEANVNTNYPDYIMVSSAAHEMAHQRGIAREDEANFTAFLVCTVSDDPYIRYSGRMDVLNDVLNALYAASPEKYAEVAMFIPKEVNRERAAYSKFFDKYRDNVVADISTSLNDAYISSHNQPAGVRSYGLYVDLVAAYLLQ